MFDSKLHSAFQNFLISQSGGNIINIKSFTVQAYNEMINPTTRGFELMSITMGRKLILECTSKNSNYFPGIESLEDRFFTFFKNHLNGISDVQIHYHYSMYCCRD
jgi:hypothetical protein